MSLQQGFTFTKHLLKMPEAVNAAARHFRFQHARTHAHHVITMYSNIV